MGVSFHISSNKELNNSAIFDLNIVSFDSGDRLNGSLYVCDPINNPSGITLSILVQEMREAAIWSNETPRQVLDEQKEAYKSQLILIEVVPYRGINGNFLIARFNHPKFPSNDDRWSEWKTFFDKQFQRVGKDT